MSNEQDLRAMTEAVARWCGVSIPSEEEARCIVAMRMVRCTGPVFTLDDGREIPIPPGESLPQPQYTNDWNARYWLYLSQALGDEITEAAKAYFRPPPPYADSLDAMREVEDEIERRGLWREYATWLEQVVGVTRESTPVELRTVWLGWIWLGARATALQRLAAAARVIEEVSQHGKD